MKKICVLVLAVSGLIAGAAYGDEPKGYRIAISEVTVGTVKLDAGEYKLLVHRDEPKVQFMEVKTGTVTDVAATVETVDSKFGSTEVHAQKVDGVNQLNEIRVGGTKIKVTFRKAT